MVERIVAGFQPARILLFGSRARGTDNRWSDVDLLVVMDEVEDKRRAAVEMGRALGDLSVSKDIVVTTHEEIARRGHVVGLLAVTSGAIGKLKALTKALPFVAVGAGLFAVAVGVSAGTDLSIIGGAALGIYISASGVTRIAACGQQTMVACRASTPDNPLLSPVEVHDGNQLA